MSVDGRFYKHVRSLQLADVQALTGATPEGTNTDIEISGLSSARNGRQGEVIFFEGDKRTAALISQHATACFVSEKNKGLVPLDVVRLVTDNPRLAHMKAGAALYRSLLPVWHDEGVSKDADVHPDAILHSGCRIGPGAAIGEGAVIGPNAVIGPGVQIGRHTNIGAGASLFYALVGDHAKILSGARIGESGFGVIPTEDGLADIPHYGRVIIQDHVTIGANTCVDKGAFEDTFIGERSKIDNLCQIGHNVVIGRNVIMAAFCGISGSVEIGDGAMLGGRVGIADHVKIGKGVNLAAASGLFRDVPDGETWGGVPAKPIKQWMRETAWLQKQAKAKRTSN